MDEVSHNPELPRFAGQNGCAAAACESARRLTLPRSVAVDGLLDALERDIYQAADRCWQLQEREVQLRGGVLRHKAVTVQVGGLRSPSAAARNACRAVRKQQRQGTMQQSGPQCSSGVGPAGPILTPPLADPACTHTHAPRTLASGTAGGSVPA